MKLSLCAAALACIMIISAGCTQTESEVAGEKEQASLDAWMSLHINTAGSTIAQRQDNGMYIEWLRRGEEGATKPITGDWVKINYTAMLMEGYDPVTQQGRIFLTRNADEARRQGTFSAYTHYVPQYIINNNLNQLMPGQQKALSLMRKGDKVRLYLTSKLFNGCYGIPCDNGYEGQLSLANNSTISTLDKPVVIEMELVDVITDPAASEQRDIIAYARDKWGLAEKDSIAEHMYLHIDEYTEGNDTVYADSAMKAPFYYIGKFLEDDFVFATNIDSVATRLGRKVDDIDTEKYNPTIQKSRFIPGFSKVFSSELITYDSRFTVIFTSPYGFGSEGSVADNIPSTIIQPYSPVIYEIIVPQKTAEEDKDK